MISPVAVSEYSKAKDNLQYGFSRLSRIVRPEIVEFTTNGNSISVDFKLSNRGASPKSVNVVSFIGDSLVRAVYGDGSSEPEVYTDNADWYRFDASDYTVTKAPVILLHLQGYFDKSEDILMRVIRLELRKALQDFLGVATIPDTLLGFCLEKNERSTLEITDRSKVPTTSIFSYFLAFHTLFYRQIPNSI